MKINSKEIKDVMNSLEEKIKKLEKKLNSENDIEMFEFNCHKIEDYKETLQKMAIKKKKIDY